MLTNHKQVVSTQPTSVLEYMQLTFINNHCKSCQEVEDVIYPVYIKQNL